jgi:hypothetical protein
MAAKKEKIVKQEENTLTQEIRKLIKEEVRGLAEKDIEEIVVALIPKVDEMISKQIREHLTAITTFVQQHIKE